MKVINSIPPYENNEKRQQEINMIYAELFKILNEEKHFLSKRHIA